MSGLRWRVLTQSQSTMRKDSECAAPWNFTVGHRKRINEAHMSRHFTSVRSDSCGTPGAAEHRAERSAAGQRRLEASAREVCGANILRARRLDAQPIEPTHANRHWRKLTAACPTTCRYVLAALPRR